MFNVEISGTGSCVPEHRVTNEQLSAFVDTSDEWIRQMTGIRERRISLGEHTTDLAVAAARKALENAAVDASEIELIIVATVSPDNFFPSTACLVQARLGAKGAACFDISAACTGFIYALSAASQFIKTGMYKTVLVVSAEVLSKITNWNDRSTCVLFADGAGAAVLRRGEAGIISGIIGAEGDDLGNLYCKAVPLHNSFIPVGESEHDCGHEYDCIHMNGREIFKFAVRIMPECILRVLEGTGYTLDDIKYFVPHQANYRIIEAAAKKLQVDFNRFYMNMHKYGNTSAASISLALDEMSSSGLIAPGDLILLAGFGGGLTYGAQLIRWTRKYREDK